MFSNFSKAIPPSLLATKAGKCSMRSAKLRKFFIPTEFGKYQNMGSSLGMGAVKFKLFWRNHPEKGVRDAILSWVFFDNADMGQQGRLIPQIGPKMEHNGWRFHDKGRRGLHP